MCHVINSLIKPGCIGKFNNGLRKSSSDRDCFINLTFFFLLCKGVCKFSSNNGDDMTKHLDGHWINNDLQCTLCEFIGKDQAALAAHRYVI